MRPRWQLYSRQCFLTVYRRMCGTLLAARPSCAASKVDPWALARGTASSEA